MKKQAAILGPTPEFVRWSIRKACALREQTEFSSPEATERCLRSIREAGIAESENRLIDGFALRNFRDPSESSEPGKESSPGKGGNDARGFFDLPGFRQVPCPSNQEQTPGPLFAFSIEEVFRPFQSLEFVQNQCFGCVANLASKEDREIAGCYGAFSVHQIGSREQIAETLKQVLADDYGTEAVSRNPKSLNWNTLFSSILPSRTQIEASILLQGIAELLKPCVYLSQLAAAYARSHEQGLQVDLSMHPAGISDGLHWTIVSHCPDCKASQSDACQSCRQCGRKGRPVAARKRKVMGRRPYVLLDSLLKPEKASQLRHQFEQQRTQSG